MEGVEAALGKAAVVEAAVAGVEGWAEAEAVLAVAVVTEAEAVGPEAAEMAASTTGPR